MKFIITNWKFKMWCVVTSPAVGWWLHSEVFSLTPCMCPCLYKHFKQETNVMCCYFVFTVYRGLIPCVLFALFSKHLQIIPQQFLKTLQSSSPAERTSFVRRREVPASPAVRHGRSIQPLKWLAQTLSYSCQLLLGSYQHWLWLSYLLWGSGECKHAHTVRMLHGKRELGLKPSNAPHTYPPSIYYSGRVHHSAHTSWSPTHQ